jgi:hypothetical protein
VFSPDSVVPLTAKKKASIALRLPKHTSTRKAKSEQAII